MHKKDLEKYCAKKNIFVPKGAPKAAYEAAIVRASLHQRDVEIPGECFGLWESENPSCLICDVQAACSDTSLGMDTKKYFKAFQALKNPKIRTSVRLSKKK